MDWRGVVFIWGSLALIVALVVFGIRIENIWGGLMIIAGVFGGIAWLFLIFDVLSAMNSDI